MNANIVRNSRPTTVQEIIDQTPGFRLLVSMSETLKELIEDARNTINPDLLRDEYECCISYYERYHAKFAEIFSKNSTKNSNEWEALCNKMLEEKKQLIEQNNKLVDQIHKEREEQETLITSLAIAAMVDPEETINTLIFMADQINNIDNPEADSKTQLKLIKGDLN